MVFRGSLKKLTDTIPISFTFAPCRKSEITGIDLSKGIIKIYGRRITGLNQDESYIRSDEQLILMHELDYQNTDDFVILADVDAKTIRFEFDADYTNYFKDYDLVKRTETQRTLMMDEITHKLKENGLTECKGFNEKSPSLSEA